MHSANYLPPIRLGRGWQGVLAYGCHGSVVVVDPRTVQPIQMLSGHKANVIKVRVLYQESPINWSRLGVSLGSHTTIMVCMQIVCTT